MSHYTQQKLGFPDYVPPILAGYASGATLAYAALVQSHVGTFRGAISLGFCPSLSVTKPPCRGDRLEWQTAVNRKEAKGSEYVFLPAAEPAAPWIVLHGESDAVCEFKTVEAFVKQTGHARVVGLPGCEENGSSGRA